MMRRAAAVAGLLLLASCVSPSRKPVITSVPAPSDARAATVSAGPAFATLGIDAQIAERALVAFRLSCPALLRRTDRSRLTQPADWQSACAAAAIANDALRFFATAFETARVGSGVAFATGYYEPEIAGVRTRQPGFDVPVYKLPADLVRGYPDDWPPEARTGAAPLGRYDEASKFVLYYDRAEIAGGALAGKGLEIAWAADPVEFFFLQVQGSGRLRAPDGSVMRIGYAGQNGREYAGIGAIMRKQGLIGSGPGQYAGSMQGIKAYLRDHPSEGQALMDQNKSWIFFKELTGAGPLGALNAPVVAGASVAADPAFVPLGAPVFLAMDRAEASGLWVAQDTGGAIKGANRFDTFWGAGEDAARTAGGMSARGMAFLLLPKGTLARLAADGGPTP